MMWAELQNVAQIAVVRIVNTLPEGILVALCAGAALRVLPRQNSSTRFVIWFVALLTVAFLPFVGRAPGHTLPFATSHAVFGIPMRWGVFLFLAWICTSSFAMLRVMTGLAHLRKLRKNCTPIDLSKLDPSVVPTVESFSSARSVTLATSEEITVPAAIGFFQPMIVIPAWALRELPSEELKIILLHEFAHLRRWDDWSNLLQKLVRAVLLLHPAVWWIENRISLEREMACDDLVLAETSNPRGYAKCLVDLLEKSMARRAVAMAQAAVHRAQEASLRLARILDAGRPSTKRSWRPALSCAAVSSIICFALAQRAPQLVEFDRPVQASPSYAARSYTPNESVHSQFPGAVVIPAALHTISTAPTVTKGNLVKPRPVVQHRSAPPLNLRAQRVPGRVINAAATQVAPQPSETFLLIRTTERTGPDSWRWSIYMYRLVWTNPQEDGANTPLTHKT